MRNWHTPGVRFLCGHLDFTGCVFLQLLELVVHGSNTTPQALSKIRQKQPLERIWGRTALLEGQSRCLLSQRRGGDVRLFFTRKTDIRAEM
mmetsp:Transcript_3155/g.5277  ORF Transcript_3155/g.5277 Transcript_3155/m.5277 type:complete len:91 (+) Transcript_3155:177-449(+)